MSSDQKLPIIDIGPGAATRLARFCAVRSKTGIRLVADVNTWEAAGTEVERELRAAGLFSRSTIFETPHLAADAESILRLLADDDPAERLYIAVGSGTITDIVRFAAHRTGREFISLATAPSVDAYTSVVAPVLVAGMKRTVSAFAPVAVFADTDVLSRAPAEMIAAGFGDMFCKFSAVADWKLGAAIRGEPFDEAIAERSLAAARSCAAAAASIGAAEPGGLAILMAALVESGNCMALAGHSRPASGAEHQYSHFWEMRLLRESRPPILHGLKVAIGTLETARLWDRVRRLSEGEAVKELARSRLAPRQEEEARIRKAFGPEADEVIAGQESFLAMSDADFNNLRGLVSNQWKAILSIASLVPSAQETGRLLALARCPTDPRDLGLREDEIAAGLSNAHYLRDRYTVKKLSLMLGIE